MGEIGGQTGNFVNAYLRALYPAKEAARPNANHCAVAALLASGRAAFAVTTNFDECLEAAGIDDDQVVVPVDTEFVTARGAP